MEISSSGFITIINIIQGVALGWIAHSSANGQIFWGVGGVAVALATVGMVVARTDNSSRGDQRRRDGAASGRSGRGEPEAGRPEPGSPQRMPASARPHS
jgi:hypothetical protein